MNIEIIGAGKNRLQVWDSNLVVDTFLGQHVVVDKETADNPFG
jgi:hypothetical protein